MKSKQTSRKMIETGPINKSDVWQLEDTLDRLKRALKYEEEYEDRPPSYPVRKELEELQEIVERLRVKSNYKLITYQEGAEFLDLSVRQVRNIAADPEKPVYKYNKDGSRKVTNRKTDTRLNLAELILYQQERR